MDAGTLARAMDQAVPLTRYAALTPAFNAAMIAAGVTNVNRAAMWCAQLGHESVGLKYMQEMGDDAYFSQYNWRQDLGNNQPGDGPRFHGRGPIQVTGRHNYTVVSQWAFQRKLVPTPTYFVDRPDELASDRYGFIGPVWYWTAARPQLNSLSDARDINGATRAINGGLNGIADRRRRYNLCLALGSALLPTQGDDMSLADDELGKRFPSRSKYRANDNPVDTAVGFILNIDAMSHEDLVERNALNGVQWAIDLVKREAAKGDKGSQAVLAKIGSK